MAQRLLSSRTIARGAGVLSVLDDYVALTKPRVMSLLLITAFGSMVLAAGGVPAGSIVASVLVGGALAAGGAGAINHAAEVDVDSAMRRTRGRPVAAGRVRPRQAIIFGAALNAAAFAVLLLGANLLAASLAISGTIIYVFVYTLWLKRTTAQNIVIGGAAGAVPPLVGWAAVTGTLDLPAWYMFAIVFFWTPPHFWALAILIRDDYRTAGVPMLPVVAGVKETARVIVLYTLLLLPLSVLLYVAAERLGTIYLTGVLVAGVVYTLLAALLWIRVSRPATARLYRFSLLYLAVLFVLVMVDGSIA